MKASTRYSLCASVPEEEGYMGRRHTPGAIKLEVDNTVMVTTGDAAEFFPKSRSSTKVTLRPLNVAFLDVAISEELWGQAKLSVPPNSPSSGPCAHATAQQNDKGASSVPGTTYSTSWWWDLLFCDPGAPLFVIYWAGWGHRLRYRCVIIQHW